MGDLLQAYQPATQANSAPTLSEMGNEYQPKGSDSEGLRSKSRHGSFHPWMHMWV